MSELHPTPTRLALLADVAAGSVRRDLDSNDYERVSGNKVNARMTELAHAGWVELPAANPVNFGNRFWRLTNAGRAVLDQHRGAET